MCAWTAAQSKLRILTPRLLFLVMILSAGQAVTSWPAQAQSALIYNSVVSVLPQWPNPAARAAEPEGSGIVVLDGRTILTARHVINNALSIVVRTSDGRVLKAEVIGEDILTDLAVLAIRETLVPMSFGRDAQVGERACAIGNAFGLGLSMTCGVVSAINKAGVGFNPIEDFVQTDAAVNPGASGGALVARDGSLLGILSAIFTKQSDANIGVNFAVSSALAKTVAKALAKDGKVNWQFSGLKLGRSVSRGDVGTLGAIVRNIRPGSPGEQAGLKIGDVILQLGHRRIKKPAEFKSAFVTGPPGARLKLKITRNKAQKMLEIQLPE